MKTLSSLLLLIAILFIGCKKDDPSGPTASSNVKIRQLPPAGFSFPHTYYEQGRTHEFKAWIKAMDVTSKYTPEYFFGSDFDFPTFQIKLIDLNKAEFKDLTTQETHALNYFFASDFLYIYTTDVPSDTLSLAKGNYNGFTVSYTSFRVTGTDQKYYGNIPGTSSYKSLSDSASKYHMTEVDTLAYYNSFISFK